MALEDHFGFSISSKGLSIHGEEGKELVFDGEDFSTQEDYLETREDYASELEPLTTDEIINALGYTPPVPEHEDVRDDLRKLGFYTCPEPKA